MEALIARAANAGVTLKKDAFVSFSKLEHFVEIVLQSGEVLKTALIIGADGANSLVRQQADIQMIGWDYDQIGIVCTISHEEDNENTAFEHFLPAGPFATLPLNAHTSSLVWTEEKERAAKILNAPNFVFSEELATRSGTVLGDVKALDKPRGFPLSVKIARSFVGERVALIGDAAHTIHPIAGQGVNLGLKDAIALSKILIDTARLGLDIGGLECLERYQSARRPHTVAMATATDSLNRLFSNESDALKIVRDFGLSVVDRIAPLKNRFIKEAAGV
jgi:2-octaprenyl-6-methoxyphenol hydroxylase